MELWTTDNTTDNKCSRRPLKRWDIQQSLQATSKHMHLSASLRKLLGDTPCAEGAVSAALHVSVQLLRS
jgi:hypothetical protein